MIQVISERKASNILGGYYELLSKTGYVAHKAMRSLMIYIFILDMVEYMHDYIDEIDYKFIEIALAEVFARGGCLFPYPVFCINRAELKTNKAIMSKKKTMDGYAVRLTESDIDKPSANPVIVNV
jgi:hypothetical protein